LIPLPSPHAAQGHLAFANGQIIVRLRHVLGRGRDGGVLPGLLRRRVFPLLGSILQELWGGKERQKMENKKIAER